MNSKPCAFCGETRIGYDYDTVYEGREGMPLNHWMKCSNGKCQARGPQSISREAAIDRWNKARPVTPKEIKNVTK